MGPGLRVHLSSVPGITEGGLLTTPFVFQCPPMDEFSVDYSFSHADYDTATAGQFSRPGGLQLRTTSFDTLFVDFASFAITEDFPPIEDMTADLIELCETGSPFLLTVAHQLPPGGFSNWGLTLAGPELQMYATLRTVRVTERAGEGDARYSNVSFVEYRDPVVATFRLGKQVKRPGGKTFPRGVTMGPDGKGVTDKGFLLQDVLTLSSLARSFYGKAEGAKWIAAANGLTDWGSNTPLIQHVRFGPNNRPIGGKLTIPAPQ